MRFVRLLGSMQVAIGALVLLMVLVVYCTLAQVHLGTFGAVEVYMRTWLLWAAVPGTTLRLPVFPGGITVGLLFAANLVAGMLFRLDRSWRKGGLWLSHLGLVLLVGGEFMAGALSRESNLAFEEGETKNWTESQRRWEVVLVDPTAKDRDRVYALSDRRLLRGGRIADARLPVTVEVKAAHGNAQLVQWKSADGASPAADRGPGRFLRVLPLPVQSADDAVNAPAAIIGLAAGATALGTWLVAADLPPQPVEAGGRHLLVSLRAERTYLSFTLTLKDFTHDIYPGTDIPKNFSSLVRLDDAGAGENRDALIWMNHPLRYRGLTFFQASFGRDDKLSILQVVRNPGWRIPYISCALVALGLAWHFLLLLRGSPRP